MALPIVDSPQNDPFPRESYITHMVESAALDMLRLVSFASASRANNLLNRSLE